MVSGDSSVALNRKEREALKFLAVHLVYGLAAALTFGIAVLATNLGNLRTLAMESSSPIAVLLLFFLGLFVTFGGVGMGVGIMSLARDDEHGLK
jgi:formate hydrogenlyase subunit 3/multisubunit Na+/H+ antiporter MnhD subunit